jgi:hypothetical protein
LTRGSHAIVCSLFFLSSLFLFSWNQLQQTNNIEEKQATMGRGNPHLPEKKKIGQCFLRATFEQGGAEGLAKVKPTDCWACHPTELPKGNYTVSAWGSLFNRLKKDAEQEAGSTGQLSSFPQYAAEDLPDCFKGGAAADGGTGGAGGGNAAAAGAGASGSNAAGGSPMDNKKGKLRSSIAKLIERVGTTDRSHR